MSESEDTKPDMPISFTNFPNLPSELRLRIWQHTWKSRTISVEDWHADHGNTDVPNPAYNERRTRTMLPRPQWEQEGLYQDPRLMEVFNETLDPADRPKILTITSSSSPLPVSLWTTSESREETLRHYTLCFGVEGGLTRVYFNFNLDTLYLNAKDFPTVPTHPTLAEIQLHQPYRFQQQDLNRLQNLMLWSTRDGHAWTEVLAIRRVPPTCMLVWSSSSRRQSRRYKTWRPQGRRVTAICSRFPQLSKIIDTRLGKLVRLYPRQLLPEAQDSHGPGIP